MCVSLSLVLTFLLFICAAIANTTAAYQVDPLAYEVKHSKYFGVNNLTCDLDPSCFETTVVNDCYNNFQLLPDTVEIKSCANTHLNFLIHFLLLLV